MQSLNFPAFTFRFQDKDSKKYIYDTIRKKFVLLTPEEWVRQHFLRYLSETKNYSAQRIFVEMALKVNGMQKRCDLVVFDKLSQPFIIGECKASHIKITQETFQQIATYNWDLKVKYLAVSNGLNHFFCEMDYENNTYKFIQELPDFQ